MNSRIVILALVNIVLEGISIYQSRITQDKLKKLQKEVELLHITLDRAIDTLQYGNKEIESSNKYLRKLVG